MKLPPSLNMDDNSLLNSTIDSEVDPKSILKRTTPDSTEPAARNESPSKSVKIDENLNTSDPPVPKPRVAQETDESTTKSLHM